MAGSIRNSIWLTTADQRLAPSSKISRAVERAKVLVGLRRRKTSPMSSRASQNAAALLFDSRTVDIR